MIVLRLSICNQNLVSVSGPTIFWFTLIRNCSPALCPLLVNFPFSEKSNTAFERDTTDIDESEFIYDDIAQLHSEEYSHVFIVPQRYKAAPPRALLFHLRAQRCCKHQRLLA